MRGAFYARRSTSLLLAAGEAGGSLSSASVSPFVCRILLCPPVARHCLSMALWYFHVCHFTRRVDFSSRPTRLPLLPSSFSSPLSHIDTCLRLFYRLREITWNNLVRSVSFKAKFNWKRDFIKPKLARFKSLFATDDSWQVWSSRKCEARVNRRGGDLLKNLIQRVSRDGRRMKVAGENAGR